MGKYCKSLWETIRTTLKKIYSKAMVVYPNLVGYLRNYLFGQIDTQVGLSDEEYLTKYGPEAFESLITRRNEIRQRWRNKPNKQNKQT